MHTSIMGTPVVIVPDEFVTTTERRQTRFPRSKKKRIRIKWSRDNRNYSYVKVESAYMVSGVLYMSESMKRRVGKLVN